MSPVKLRERHESKTYNGTMKLSRDGVVYEVDDAINLPRGGAAVESHVCRYVFTINISIRM